MSDELATAARFDGRAGLYARYRPTYPVAAVAAVLDGLGAAPDAVDVGAGTGISTRLLVAAGARTIAIEPSDDMRAVAVASGLDARPGRASGTGLPGRCADVVTAFQAFHWFATADALAEFRRLLRPGGRVALVWNARDTRGDAFTREVRAIERRWSGGDATAGRAFVDGDLEPLLIANGFPRVRRLQVEHAQRLDAAGLAGRVRSTSYAPREGAALAGMLRALADVHARYADRSGHVSLCYATDVVIAEPSS